MTIHSRRIEQILKKRLQHIRYYFLAQQDARRFLRHASLSSVDSDEARLTTRIMYNVHALEKGLARNYDLRPRFGQKALKNLNDAMALYQRAGHDTEAFPFLEGIGVLRKYVELHQGLGYPVDFLDAIVDPAIYRGDVFASATAGTIAIRAADKEENHRKNFHDLAIGRSSVREFSGGPIPYAKVQNALRIALKTPSVCNRQGWRAHWIEDKTQMAEVLRHQRGFGYKTMPEVLLCVTVSTSTFVSPVERNQGYVDGGLFSMSILYALEHEGLAAVPLNACLYTSAQRAIRDLVSIADSELIIMFIAIGAFPETSKAPASSRKPLLSVLVKH